jgi:hypothetical protein
MVKHVVLIRVRGGTPEADVARVLDDLKGLVGVIPGLVECSGGANNSPEGKAEGYTHGFVMTFESVAARDGYLPHPEHRRAASGLRAFADGILVLDYEG